ncbi:hypothetical protein [Paenibacillus illinoisensis]|uniref:hypothetical protein n=1 Tax=Paenibacillus illinoisensis TaxID=59845 RepID=UPI003015B5A5
MKNHYTICHRNINGGSGPILKETIALPNVRSLAKYLNKFKKKNPKTTVIVAYVSDSRGKCLNNVKFLPIEYKAQKWLVGNKERLLLNAVEQGYKLKWNHGLKPIG